VLPVADVTAFDNINPDAVLHVPADAIEEYRTTAPWCDFKHIVAIGQEEETDYISSIQYVFYPEDHTATVVNIVVQNTDRITIPATVQVENETYRVTTIGEGLCYRNQDIKYIEFEEGIIEIQNSVFMECENLRSVAIPNSVETIGESAFSACMNLQSVILGKGIKRIEANAFSYSFSPVIDVWCYAEQVPETATYYVLHYNDNTQSTLHVPASALEAYKSTAPWNHFKNIVALTEEETGIEETLSPLPLKEGGLFNLNGQRINTLQKGLNIVDGKKVWVK
jgi:hypothetical protein